MHNIMIVIISRTSEGWKIKIKKATRTSKPGKAWMMKEGNSNRIVGVRWGRSFVGGGGYRSLAFGRLWLRYELFCFLFHRALNRSKSLFWWFTIVMSSPWSMMGITTFGVFASTAECEVWHACETSQSVCGPSNVSVQTLLALQSNHQMRALARWNSRAFHYFTDPAVIVIITKRIKQNLLFYPMTSARDMIKPSRTQNKKEKETQVWEPGWPGTTGNSIVLWRPSWRWDIHFLAKPCAATIILPCRCHYVVSRRQAKTTAGFPNPLCRELHFLHTTNYPTVWDGRGEAKLTKPWDKGGRVFPLG